MMKVAPIWIVRRALARFNANSGSVVAGYFAYATLLAIFPFLIFAVSLTGQLIGPDKSAEAVAALFEIAPEHVALTLEPVVMEVVSSAHGLFTMFIVIALWVSMGAVEAISTAFDRAYGDVTNSIFLRVKLKSLAVVLIGSVIAILLGFLILLAPIILANLQEYVPLEWQGTINMMRYLIGITVFYLFLWLLHLMLPNGHAAGYRVWPGVLVSTVLWIAMASGFSVYISLSPNYAVTYGTLAGVAITMVFLYLTGAVTIFGAELNAALKNWQERK